MLYVSFTSWKNRIDLCKDRVSEMLNQSLKPDKIYLNLSLEEFPNKEQDLPKELTDLLSDSFEIIWCEDNDYSFKKLIPVVKKHYQEDILIATIDDDLTYKPIYLETLVFYYNRYGGDKFCLAQIPDNGSRELHRCQAYKDDFWKCLTREVIETKLDDIYYRIYLLKHNKQVTHLMQNEVNQLPKGLIVDIETDCKISHIYCPNGVVDSNYINSSIQKMNSIIF